jgi:hypothetical protein
METTNQPTNKPTSPKMDRMVQVRLNETQYNVLVDRANRSNLNISDYIRKTTTGRAK